MAALNYHHLRYFWAVAHDGNLTRTAERLNLSQSALSIQIRKLEERLGHDLFERRGRQLHLTEAGRIALDHADTIFSAGDELIGTLRETGRSRHILRVGALATLSRNFQIQFLEPVLGREDVEVVLRSGTSWELLQSLQSLNLDVVLANMPPPADAGSAYVSHRLEEQQASLVGVPSLFSDDDDLSTLLSRVAVILPTESSGLRVGFDALANRLGIAPNIAAEVDDMAMMRLLTRAGIGIGVLPPIVVKGELETGRLVEANQLPGIVETFYAVTLARRFPNPLLPELLPND